MARSLYIAAAGPDCGKSIVALGMLHAMRRRVERVAVFRPVVRAGPPDPFLRMLRSRLTPGAVPVRTEATASLDPASLPEDDLCWGVTYDDVHADPEAAVATIVERFRALDHSHDAVLIVGTDYTDVGAPTELAFNGQVAVNLGAPVLLVVSGHRRTPQEIVTTLDIAQTGLSTRSCQTLGVLANRVAPADVEAVRTLLRDRPCSHVISELPLLSAPTVTRVMEACSATQLFGDRTHLDAEILGFVVAAMTLPRVLEHLQPHSLVLLPGDRSDMLCGVLMAHEAHTFPPLSGVLLTGGLTPEPSVQRLVEGLSSTLPVLSTPLNTFEAATVASTTHGSITDGSAGKAEAALEHFAEHVDGLSLLDRLELAKTDAVTPLMFEHDLVERARAQRQRIVLPEGTEPRVLQAAAQALHRGIADIILLGDPDQVAQVAARVGADVSGATIVDPGDRGVRHRLAVEYARARAHKGVAFDAAWDVVTDVSYAGTLLVALGEADGMVSGAVHTTAHTIRPAFEVIRPVPGLSVVSSVFFMCLADRVLVYGDCAVNPDPTATQLADIAISSAATAVAFGVEARVAMLSYSTGESGSGVDVDKVREATRLVRERAPSLEVEGPIQYDAAIDAGVARTKLPDSGVAGRATVFVFPDLNTGNNTYKAVQRSAGALAVGPVLQGLRKPVNDLSRGATVPDILTTIAITAVQSSQLGAGLATAAEAR